MFGKWMVLFACALTVQASKAEGIRCADLHLKVTPETLFDLIHRRVPSRTPSIFGYYRLEQKTYFRDHEFKEVYAFNVSFLPSLENNTIKVIRMITFERESLNRFHQLFIGTFERPPQIYKSKEWIEQKLRYLVSGAGMALELTGSSMENLGISLEKRIGAEELVGLEIGEPRAFSGATVSAGVSHVLSVTLPKDPKVRSEVAEEILKFILNQKTVFNPI